MAVIRAKGGAHLPPPFFQRFLLFYQYLIQYLEGQLDRAKRELQGIAFPKKMKIYRVHISPC